MGGADATPNLWKHPFSAVRASGGYPGNASLQSKAVSHWLGSNLELALQLETSEIEYVKTSKQLCYTQLIYAEKLDFLKHNTGVSMGFYMISLAILKNVKETS